MPADLRISVNRTGVDAVDWFRRLLSGDLVYACSRQDSDQSNEKLSTVRLRKIDADDELTPWTLRSDS